MKRLVGDYTGIYRAYVASNEDPLELGRIRIRVPFLHGIEGTMSYILDRCLPFATPCFPSASADSGMFLVPEVGSTVLVMFEDGDKEKPVYLGQCYGKADDETVKSYGYPNSDIYVNSEGLKEKRASVDEVPLNAYKNGKINRHILYKSSKGQSIEINENDEQESFNIFDRLGQVFSMSSPETASNNAYGVYNRGIFSVLKELFTRPIERVAILILKSLSGSKLRFVSHNDYSKTDLVTVYQDSTAGISVNIGKDNRLLIFYQDSKLEFTRNSINIDVENLNINSSKVNINSDEVLSSANIKVGHSTSKAVGGFEDYQEENEIE